ncbi:helix-turn-helix domain-containing protein [Nocardia sp. NPDC052112]|uniref:helix-turn-helix domain-containing protein n=1 Tax=Nocardia sp. NPDC052112 TaxID=3155646 RepID=UPI003414326A
MLDRGLRTCDSAGVSGPVALMAGYRVPEGWTVQSYRFALDPTLAQERVLASHAGAARKAFNVMLDVVKANLAQRAAERSYGSSEDRLTPLQGWSLAALRKSWNQRKTVVAPWWATNTRTWSRPQDPPARRGRQVAWKRQPRTAIRPGRRGLPLRKERLPETGVVTQTLTLQVTAESTGVVSPAAAAHIAERATRPTNAISVEQVRPFPDRQMG